MRTETEILTLGGLLDNAARIAVTAMDAIPEDADDELDAIAAATVLPDALAHRILSLPVKTDAGFTVALKAEQWLDGKLPGWWRDAAAAA